ncbi:M28 family peptidase [Bacteriovoracaceae bacterium]|nr:M28 family peptidase [Bacteriovoracaceae bacterium]
MNLNSKIFLIFLLSFQDVYAFSLRKSEKRPESVIALKQTINKYPKSKLIKNLREFIKCCNPNRMVGTPGHENASVQLIKQIKEFDKNNSGLVYVDNFVPDLNSAIKLYQNDFDNLVEGKIPKSNPEYKKWKTMTDQMVNELNKRKGIKGKNIIWEKKGYLNPDDIIVVGAHFDNIGHDKKTFKIKTDSFLPGADDNGSGVAIALSLIDILSKMDSPKTIRVVFFDFEEFGFLGSKAFVEKYKDEFKRKNFVGMINLEMLGTDTVDNDSEKKKGNMKAYIRKNGESGYQSDLKLAKRLTNTGKQMTFSVDFEIGPNGFNQSDHINFWDNGFNAVTFSQNWESDFNHKGYHSENDFVERLNFTTLYGSFQYISGAIIGLSYDFL